MAQMSYADALSLAKGDPVKLLAALVAGESVDGKPAQGSPLSAFADETITVSTTAVGFTQATYADAKAASMVTAGGPIRIRLSGSLPTSTIGYEAADGSSVDVEGAGDIANFRMIRSGGADVTVFVTYWH